jgi:hypothetical protein
VARTDDADYGLLVVYARVQRVQVALTGLVSASNKTVAGIAREVLPANSKRALNKFLTEYDWDKEQFNHERLEELQKHGETRWSKDGYIILDDTIIEKAGDEVLGVCHFYDLAEGGTVWGQNLIYAFYADEKRPIRSLSVSTKNRTKITKTTTSSTISPVRSSPNSKKR